MGASGIGEGIDALGKLAMIGLGAIILLLLSPVLLKATGQVEWSWFWSCSPILAIVLIVLVLMIFDGVDKLMKSLVESSWKSILRKHDFVNISTYPHRDFHKKKYGSTNVKAGEVYEMLREHVSLDYSMIYNELPETIEVMMIKDYLHTGGIMLREDTNLTKLRKRVLLLNRIDDNIYVGKSLLEPAR